MDDKFNLHYFKNIHSVCLAALCTELAVHFGELKHVYENWQFMPK